MIYNISGTLLFAISAWLTGLGALKACGLTKGRFSNLHFISIPLGVAVCAIISTTMYFALGLSVGAIRIAYAVLAVMGAFILWKTGLDKKELSGLAAILILFGIMMIPGLLHGDKYYVHRGNLYDQYFYMSQVVYMGTHKLSYGLSGIMNAEGAVDVIRHGFNATLIDRPTAPLLCAVLTGKSWGNVFFQAYLLIQLVWASAFGAMMLALEMVTGKVKKALPSKKTTLLLATLTLAFLWGFFGQIQYDMDAWSQMITLGSLLSMACVYFCILPDLLEGRKMLPGQYMILLLLGAGNFIIYPENTMLLGALLVAVSIAACIARKKTVSPAAVGILVTIPVLAVVIAAITNFNIVKFTLFQISTSTSDVRQSWASYFNQYWLGFHTFIAGSPMTAAVKKLTALLPSIFGMFIITPDYEVRILPVTALWLAFTALVSIGLLVIIGFAVRKSISSLRREETQQEGFFTLIAAGSLILFAVMMAASKFWSAGKLFLYMSPYIFIMISMPFRSWIFNDKEDKIQGNGTESKTRTGGTIKSVIRWFAIGTSVLFLSCQVIFAGMRVYDTMANKDCTGYLGNYPSDQAPYLKEKFRYDFDASQYAGEPIVAINIEDMWYLDYIKISLAYEGIQYYAVPDNVFDRGQLNEVQPSIQQGHRIITLNDIEGTVQ